MRPTQFPRRHMLPELPRGCDELQATEFPESDMRLRAHLDCLPGLGIKEANTLAHFAVEPTPSAPDEELTASEEPVLGLEDLLRTQREGHHVLHPRVLQVVSLGALDSLLETITTRLDKQPYYSVYQYPAYLLECRGSAPNQTTLYPPAFFISTLDVIQDLRANDFLTTICRPGDSMPDEETLRAAVDSVERRGEHPHGVFTLRLAETGPEQYSTLVFRDGITTGRCPEHTELFQFLVYLCVKHDAPIEVQKESGPPWGDSDD